MITLQDIRKKSKNNIRKNKAIYYEKKPSIDTTSDLAIKSFKSEINDQIKELKSSSGPNDNLRRYLKSRDLWDPDLIMDISIDETLDFSTQNIDNCVQYSVNGFDCLFSNAWQMYNFQGQYNEQDCFPIWDDAGRSDCYGSFDQDCLELCAPASGMLGGAPASNSVFGKTCAAALAAETDLNANGLCGEGTVQGVQYNIHATNGPVYFDTNSDCFGRGWLMDTRSDNPFTFPCPNPSNQNEKIWVRAPSVCDYTLVSPFGTLSPSASNGGRKWIPAAGLTGLGVNCNFAETNKNPNSVSVNGRSALRELVGFLGYVFFHHYVYVRGYFYANAEISIDAPIHGFGYPNPPSDHIRFRRKISGGGKLYATFFEATFGFSGAIPSLSASVTGAKDNSMYCSIAVIPESS